MTCEFCKTREATMHFGDMLSFTHGGQPNCCDLCCAEMQLEHALERQAALPELVARRDSIKARLDAEAEGAV